MSIFTVHGVVHSHGFFLNKANHYDKCFCYTVCKSKIFGGTSENVAKQRYDVIKMAAILNLQQNILCLIKSLLLGRI